MEADRQELQRRPRAARRALLVALLAGSLFLLSKAWHVEGNIFNDPFNDWSFDAATWAQQPDQRGRMFDSLRDGLLRDRPDRVQVQALLGAPDEAPCAPDDRCWSYYIGWWSGMRIDPDSLQVSFGDDGRVEQVCRVQH